MRAEATPHYLYWSEKVAPRIKEVYGERPAKFVVSFRDPVSRAHSWYWNMIREGREDLDFDEALRVEEYRLEQNRSELYQLDWMVYGYSAGSRYASLLRLYLELCSAEDFFFVFQDDLKSQEVDDVCAGLVYTRLESSIQISSSNSNPAAMPRSTLLHKTIRQRSLLKEFIKPFMPGESDAVWNRK